MGHKAKTKLRDWAVLQTKKALAKRVKQHWLAMLDKADPMHVAVHRAIFAATAKCCEAAKDPALYSASNKFLLSDIIKYRAAAMSLNYFNYEVRGTENFDP